MVLSFFAYIMIGALVVASLVLVGSVIWIALFVNSKTKEAH